MPQRRRPTTRRATTRDGSASREPSLAPAFASALRGARGLHAEPNPVEVEAFASSVLSIMPRDLVDVDDPELFFGGRLVEYLVGRRTDDALALLHGLSAVTGSEVLARLAH